MSHTMDRVDERMLFASRTKSIIRDCSFFDRLCLFASSCMFAFSRNVERSVVHLNLKKWRHENASFDKLWRFYFELKSMPNASRLNDQVCFTLYKSLICILEAIISHRSDYILLGELNWLSQLLQFSQILFSTSVSSTPTRFRVR